MIHVNVTDDTGKELALLRIEPAAACAIPRCDLAHYMVSVVVDRKGATGIHSRLFVVRQEKKTNVLALVKRALDELDDDILELES